MTFEKLLVAFIVSTMLSLTSLAADEQSPLPGKWEKSATAYLYDFQTNIYKPWGRPKTVSCFTADTFKQIPGLTPASSKVELAQLGMACEVSEVKAEESSTSWRMQCKKNGIESTTQISVVTTETEIRSTTVTQDNDSNRPLGPDGLKTESLIRRVGNCE